METWPDGSAAAVVAGGGAVHLRDGVARERRGGTGATPRELRSAYLAAPRWGTRPADAQKRGGRWRRLLALGNPLPLSSPLRSSPRRMPSPSAPLPARRRALHPKPPLSHQLPICPGLAHHGHSRCCCPERGPHHPRACRPGRGQRGDGADAPHAMTSSSTSPSSWTGALPSGRPRPAPSSTASRRPASSTSRGTACPPTP